MAPSVNRFRQAELRFRQSCCLTMSGPLIAPALFRDLQSLVPYSSCLYMWLGPTGPIDAYFNLPEIGQSLPLYAHEYFRGKEREIWATTDEAVKREVGPKLLDEVLRVPRQVYLRHPIYNEILRPAHACTFVRLLVRDGGVPIGTFTVGRSGTGPGFAESDRDIIGRLEPYIVHALAQRDRKVDLANATNENAALVTVDRHGNLEAQSGTAPLLLSLSQGSALSPPIVHGGLRGLVRTLSTISDEELTARAPVWTTRNTWGEFSARAYWLEQTNTSSRDLIGIYLERRVPRHLAMLNGLRALALPRQQEQVTWLLALGHTEEQVGQAMGLSRNTVIYHRRQVYTRLDLDSRMQLEERLARTPGGSR